MKNKKSFLLYTDYNELFNELSDEDAGQLIKHIFSYVNDENPETENPFVKLSFIAIKKQFKRDLVKWEKSAERSRENGKLGGRPPKPKETQRNPEKPSGLIDNPDEPRKPDNVTVNDTVTVNGTVNVIKEEKKKKAVPGAKTALFNSCKSEFKIQYLAITGNEYYFDKKSAGSLNPLIAKIKFSIKEKKGNEATDSEVLQSLQYILTNLPDAWYKENLSLPILNSKYNEIINQLRNGKNSKIKQFNDLKSGLNKIDEMYRDR